MKETIEVINQMQADGVIGRYAIGGAVGATFYLEPIATVDLDIFLEFPVSTGSLVSVTPIYDYLIQHGGVVLHEYIVIRKWPVQFLPVSNALQREALDQAREIDLDGTPTRVFLAEHLIAIALSTGRAKDHSRILQFLSERAVDQHKMRDVIERHGLGSQWQAFEKRFLHE
jgi:hypothetical protein